MSDNDSDGSCDDINEHLSSRLHTVTVVLNKWQTTSPVDAAPSTDHLRGSLFRKMRLEHGSRTMLRTYEWCVMAHARRRRLHTQNGPSWG